MKVVGADGFRRSTRIVSSVITDPHVRRLSPAVAGLSGQVRRGAISDDDRVENRPLEAMTFFIQGRVPRLARSDCCEGQRCSEARRDRSCSRAETHAGKSRQKPCPADVHGSRFRQAGRRGGKMVSRRSRLWRRWPLRARARAFGIDGTIGLPLGAQRLVTAGLAAAPPSCDRVLACAPWAPMHPFQRFSRARSRAWVLPGCELVLRFRSLDAALAAVRERPRWPSSAWGGAFPHQAGRGTTSCSPCSPRTSTGCRRAIRSRPSPSASAGTSRRWRKRGPRPITPGRYAGRARLIRGTSATPAAVTSAQPIVRTWSKVAATNPAAGSTPAGARAQ